MLEIVRRRRSIRRYDERPVPPELVAELREAVLRAPSSRNLRPWRFTFVTDRATLEALSTAKASYAQPLAGAALAVVFSADESVSDCWVEDCSIAATILQLTATDLGLGSCWIQMRGRADAEATVKIALPCADVLPRLVERLDEPPPAARFGDRLARPL